MKSRAAVALASIVMALPAPVGAGHLDGLHQAFADVEPTQGNTARGRILISTIRDRVLIAADFQGLAPGRHGLSIDESGDCSSAGAKNAGGHRGVLGNVMADGDGKAEFRTETKGLSVEAGKSGSIVGHSVVLHADAHDQTQPAGNAGARIACGVLAARM
jgi:superoxide dismutase, Cu-Zn family